MDDLDSVSCATGISSLACSRCSYVTGCDITDSVSNIYAATAPPVSVDVLRPGPWLSLRTKFQFLVLALALKVYSLVLSLALRVESLVLALAMRVISLLLSLALRIKSLVMSLALRVQSLVLAKDQRLVKDYTFKLHHHNEHLHGLGHVAEAGHLSVANISDMFSESW